MAWRIEESVIRGEIDNRVRGCVTGRIWFTGRAAPVELALTGNCWRDLAGRRLEFTNREPKPGVSGSFAARQEGAAGDITASRKVKVPDIPLDQIGEYYAQKKPFPWHWGNSLYLEWFSARNGRVVIESASYELKIVGEPAWEMTLEEEETQRRANGEALTGFMERLGEAATAHQAHEDTEWNEKPQTEAEAEQMQEQSDRLVDRIQGRLAREGAGADYEKILREEIGRMRKERGEPEPTPEQRARNAKWIDEMNRAGEEAVNDPGLREDAEREHPLAAKARELALQMMSEPEERGWVKEQDSEEHPVVDLIGAVMKASAKLAGALNGDEWPPVVELCAGTIVRLKKARVYLDDALRAMESCQEQKLTDTGWLGMVLVEVIDLAHEADILIAELRARLERGTD
jgi:hypothetical protein